jgi:hypothetical protein
MDNRRAGGLNDFPAPQLFINLFQEERAYPAKKV